MVSHEETRLERLSESYCTVHRTLIDDTIKSMRALAKRAKRLLWSSE